MNVMTTNPTDGFFLKGEKTSQFHTHNTALSSLSLILTCQISRSPSLTGSPTHNCVFSQREEKECEPQASNVDVCLYCVFFLSNQ